MTPTRATPALLLAAGLASGLAFTTAAWAQTSPTAPTATPPSATSTAAPDTGTAAPPAAATSAPTMRHGMHSMAARPMNGETMETMVEKRITQLHSRLHITDAQAPQWDQFTQVMRANARDMDQGYQTRAGKVASMSAPENMQSFADLSQQRAQDMQKLVPAFQTLYASLSDDQKRTADQMFRNEAERAQAHHAPTHQ